MSNASKSSSSNSSKQSSAKYPRVIMYGALFCPYCMRARKLLKSKGVEYDEIRVDSDRKQRKEMERLAGRNSVPQIFIGKTHIGGYDEMAALNRKGELDALLESL